MSATPRKGFTGRIERGPMAADVLRRDFATIYNRALRDKRLSRRARGLMAEILTHRDGFGVSMASLLANGPEGKDALTVALRELEACGYLHRERERNELGHLGDTVFQITDMPDGLLIGAETPWEAPEENRRSEPKAENPAQAGSPQNRRSEPKADFPAQAFPAQGDPLHKKPNSSCGAEDHLSPARHTSDGTAVVGRERDAAAQDEAEAVVDAFVAASPRPVLSQRRRALRAQAAELLEAGYPAVWVAARAAEMPDHGWTDLAVHCERSRVPLPGQQSGPGAAAPGGRGEPDAETRAAMAAILARGSGL
ncbi:hypothetical protein [Streptomyces sp. NBC_00304]|uniref:hypothetical protein n=1 Tax=Streptomyces sp. NBC_00304 TaxID=2975706 RepID=UPI002E289C5C|nr:hypothetical protein [Streptomyces sp. NBC_00304]